MRTDNSRRLSYAHCGSSAPLLGETVSQALHHIAVNHPQQQALVSRVQGRRFTYREFNQIVDRTAKSFMHLGIERGDRVAIWSVNNYEWIVAQFATARIGAVLVNINPAYRTHELEYVLRESRCKALLLIESFKSSNYLEMFYEVCPEARHCLPGQIDSWRFPHLKGVIFIGKQEHPGMFTRREFAMLGDEMGEDELRLREAALEIDDIINIQYTSGTTGFPKGVLLTHSNIVNNGFFIGEMMKLTAADRVCVPVPFYHCFGMVVSNLAALTHGATIVIPAPAFDALATLQAVQDEKCTVLHGVPTMFIAELDHPEFESFDLSSLRTGIMAGAPCPIEVMKNVIERMHMRDVLIAYGMTESSPVSTITRTAAPIERRVSTVGTVMPHQELKIIDPLTGKTLPCGRHGEICFRGYHVMAGYDNNPQPTAEAIDAQHWLHSGDLGSMDPDGYVQVTGRIKEMVIRGGENIYPREIEEFLHTLPLVADAQVVGVPDKKYGEELLACVKLSSAHKSESAPSEEEFREMCRGKISHFKIPRYWMVVQEFPLTVTGKVQKFRIREMGIRLLSLDDAEKIATN
jgi:fatty-acyl-CoA synthase